VRRALALVGAGSLAAALWGFSHPVQSFAGPDSIFWRIDVPLAGCLLALLFARLPGTGRLALVSVLFTVALVETGARLVVAARAPRIESYVAEGYYRGDDLLGYAPTPGAVTPAWKRWNGRLLYSTEYAIDEHGRRVTPIANRPERDRFALFFGDSCTFGEGVAQQETLPFFAGQLAPSVMPYNYGFHGYGPQQMLARLESGRLRAEIVEADGVLVYLFIDAHVSRAIGSLGVYTQWADAMPFYALDASGRPQRHGNFNTGRPLVAMAYSLLGRSALLEAFRVDLPARIDDRHVELTAALLGRSQELFHAQFGPQRFVVVAFPGSKLSGRLGAALKHQGVELLDFSALLDPDRAEYHIPEDWHPTALTNRVLAEHVVEALALGRAGYSLARSVP